MASKNRKKSPVLKPSSKGKNQSQSPHVSQTTSRSFRTKVVELQAELDLVRRTRTAVTAMMLEYGAKLPTPTVYGDEVLTSYPVVRAILVELNQNSDPMHAAVGKVMISSCLAQSMAVERVSALAGQGRNFTSLVLSRLGAHLDLVVGTYGVLRQELLHGDASGEKILGMIDTLKSEVIRDEDLMHLEFVM